MEKSRILVVEDEAIIAMELENQLQSLGYEVTSMVDTGEKAIEKAEMDDPDLILMDIRIKGNMDGIDTAEEIRNRFGIPVVFSTAYLDGERIERAKITMPFGYVLKPIQERDLKVTLEMALYVAKVDAERKKAEKALKKNEENLRTTLNSIGDAVIATDIKGTITGMNPVAENLTGWKRTEAEKKPLTEVFNIINARTKEKVVNPVTQVLEKGQVVGLANHTVLIAKDGSQYHIADSGSPIRNADDNITGVVLVFRDVTEEYLMRQRVIESEKQFRSLFDSMIEGVCLHELVYDDSGKAIDYRILNINPQYEKILQLNKSDIVGKIATKVYQTNEAPYLEIYSQVAETGKPFRFEVYFPPMEKHFSISAFSLRKGEFATVFEDITEHKQAEEKLQKKTHDLEERVKEFNCLYGISELANKPSIKLEEIIQGVVDLIPPSRQYPNITCSRISIDDQEYKTENFKLTQWKQSAEIIVNGEQRGVIEICYLEEKPEIDEGPFLKEERNLINEIADRLGKIISRG